MRASSESRQGRVSERETEHLAFNAQGSPLPYHPIQLYCRNHIEKDIDPEHDVCDLVKVKEEFWSARNRSEFGNPQRDQDGKVEDKPEHEKVPARSKVRIGEDYPNWSAIEIVVVP